MRKIQVCIRGRNLLMKVEGETKKRGFYAARSIEAPDVSTAVTKAMAGFRSDLEELVLNSTSAADAPVMTVLDAHEVYFFEDTMMVTGKVIPCEGYVWEDEEKAEEKAAPPPWTAGWKTFRKSLKERDIHIHSMLLHFTNGLFPIAVLFMILGLVFGKSSFDLTYFYLMIIATLSAPVSYASGVLEWRRRYQSANKEIFIKKIRYGVTVFIIGLLGTVWRALMPDIITEPSLMTVPFVILNLSILVPIVYLGHLGSKIISEGEEALKG